MIIVSRKPIMAGYQLLVFKMLYIYVMLTCDTLINYYLLTYYLLYHENWLHSNSFEARSTQLSRAVKRNIDVISTVMNYVPYRMFEFAKTNSVFVLDTAGL